jgi:hypothetical protein
MTLTNLQKNPCTILDFSKFYYFLSNTPKHWDTSRLILFLEYSKIIQEGLY